MAALHTAATSAAAPVTISSPGEMSDSPTILKSQSVISSWGGSRARPYAFTEQGVAMLSSVLRSETAVLVSIRIMDAFVAMRKAIASFAPMLMRLDVIERRQIADQAKNDANQVHNEERFKLILDAMQDKSFPPQKVFVLRRSDIRCVRADEEVRAPGADRTDRHRPVLRRLGTAARGAEAAGRTGDRGEKLPEQAAPRRRRGAVQRAIRKLADGQDF